MTRTFPGLQAGDRARFARARAGDFETSGCDIVNVRVAAMDRKRLARELACAAWRPVAGPDSSGIEQRTCGVLETET